MNNTFSSFQQDLALEQASRQFNDEEGEHIIRTDLRPKKAAENEGGLKNLGLAIMVIFQSKRSALRKAMADLEIECMLGCYLTLPIFVRSSRHFHGSLTNLLKRLFSF
jgi:hypothetical protein